MPATPDLNAAEATSHLAPLVFFYGLGSARPRATFIPLEQLPEDERWLLAHDGDMTSRLREFHHSEIDLDVHAKQKVGAYLVRASVLNRRRDGIPVEFGAIGIHVDMLPEAAQRLVSEGHIPLGGILESERVPFHFAVAKAYEGYRREAISVDHEMAKRLLGLALDRLDEAPLRLVEKESHGSPWQDVMASWFGGRDKIHNGYTGGKVGTPDLEP